MAEDIVFSTSIDADGKGAKSLRQLKQEFKDLQKELQNTKVGTDEYNKTLQKLGAVKDDIGDLNQTISALNPEGKVQAFANVAGKLAGGFQAATGAAALFGIQSEELEKTLLRVQAATALAQGIQSVVGLTDAFKVLGAVIAANPIMSLVTVLAAVSAAVVILAKNTDDYTSVLDKQARLQKQINEDLERNLELDKLLAKSESDKIEIELQAEIKRYAALRTRQILLGEIQDKTEEQFEEKKKLDKEEADSYNNIIKMKIMLNQQLRKEEVEGIQKSAEIAAKYNTEFYKQQIENEQLQDKVLFDLESMSWEEVILPMRQMHYKTDVDLKVKSEEQKRKEDEKTAWLRDQIAKKQAQTQADELKVRLGMEQNYLSAVTDLSATYYNTQLAKVKGNVKEEEKLRRKQFESDKALRVVQAIMNTAEGVTANLKFPPLAIAIGIAGAAQVAKILSTQYNGGGSASSNVDIGVPQIQTSAPQPVTTPLTRLNEQGQNLTRAYVVETDITDSQRRINRLAEQATFG